MEVTLVSLLVLALCKPGLQSAMLGLCLHDDSFCTELAENETCRERTAQQATRANTEICTSDNHQTPVYHKKCEDISNGQSGFESFTCSNNTPLTEWPSLNYTLSHIDKNMLLVTMRWEVLSEVDVSGYSLFITDQSWSYQEYENVKIHCRVTNISRDSTEFLYNVSYKSHHEFDGQLNIHIKLIPHGWCDGPNQTVEVPSCISFCPGNCNACNIPKDFIPPPGPEILSVSLCMNPVTNSSMVFVVWETTNTYHGSYPNETYYVAVYRGGIHSRNRISKHIEVVGKTSVELHNLTLSPGQKYHVRVWSFECNCGVKSTKEEFVLDNITPCSPSKSPTSFKTTTTPGSSSTLITPSSSRSITTPITPTSTANLTSSTSTISHTYTTLPTSTINLSTSTSTNSITTFQANSSNSDWILFSLIFLTIAAAVFITITIAACYLRRHSSTLQFHKTTLSLPPCCLRRHSSNLQFHKEEKTFSLPPCKTKALLIYSLRTSTEDVEYILENFVQPLRLYGVQVLFYDILYSQVGIPQWMEKSIAQSSKVFLLYNSQLKKEWEDSTTSLLEGNLVHILKQNFVAHVSMSSDYMSKYALLLSKPDSERTTISSNYLYNLQKFVVDPQDPEKLKQTVRFITNCKTYCVTPDD